MSVMSEIDAEYTEGLTGTDAFSFTSYCFQRDSHPERPYVDWALIYGESVHRYEVMYKQSKKDNK